MKKMMIALLLMVAANGVKAQDIEVSKFERNYTSLIASMNPVYDNTGEACAVIRFFVRDGRFIIEPNMGMMKLETLPGEIRIWVPKGTKRLTIRREGLLPLSGYEIPVSIEPKVTYEAEISVNEGANKHHNVYAGVGYNAVAISGPSVALGFDINHHNIELGAVLGLNKTDEMYFYNSNGDLTGAFEYKAIRVQLRYGYDFEITDFFSIMPQAGVAYNIFTSNEVVKSNSKFDSANSFSGIVAARLVTSFNKRFKLHITPEYNFSLNKNDNCKILSDFDSKFKSWTEGFNMNIGLIYFF